MNTQIGNFGPPQKIAILIVLCLSLAGCIFSTANRGPGFICKIKVEELYVEDLQLIETILLKNSYKLIFREENDHTEKIKYIKGIKKNDETEGLEITAGISAIKSENSAIYKDVEIGVFNLHHGENEDVKKQINSISDLLIKDLERIKGKDRVFFESYNTGPPLI
jgi:hypothetical protein